MDEITDALHLLLGLGLGEDEIEVWQMALRAVAVYVATVTMVRLAKKRFMGRATAFDVILAIVLGSIVSRAITGNAPLFSALAAAATLLAMHWLFSGLALHWPGFGAIIKGRPRLLVSDETIHREALRKSHLTDRDLEEALRIRGISRLEEVSEVRLERSGEISVIKAQTEPRIVEVAVAGGVQTIRIEMS